MTDDRLQLTRRKLLAGTTAIGATGVGAGIGTSALFSDEESFTDNDLQAGELNLQVAANIRAQNSAMPSVQIDGNGSGSTQDTADGNTVTITASDMKPGDWFLVQWEVYVCGNPGHVQVTSVPSEYVNDEGRNPEPETDTSAPGDLGGALLTSVWEDYSPTSSDSRADLETLDSTTDLNDSGLSGYETPDTDGVTSGGAHYTTMDEAHAVYEDGVTLRDPSTGDPLVVGCDQSSHAVYYQLFELPRDVGNDVQGDSLTFTLRFDAEQSRNNDSPFDT